MTDDKLMPCREAFEAAFCHLDLTRYTDGDGYNSKITNRTWKGWKTAWNTRPSEALRLAKEALLNPDMPSQQIRLHMGEMTAQEERTARAAIAWANKTVLAAIEKEGV
jgi:hypothetical protein